MPSMQSDWARHVWRTGVGGGLLQPRRWRHFEGIFHPEWQRGGRVPRRWQGRKNLRLVLPYHSPRGRHRVRFDLLLYRLQLSIVEQATGEICDFLRHPVLRIQYDAMESPPDEQLE